MRGSDMAAEDKQDSVELANRVIEEVRANAILRETKYTFREIDTLRLAQAVLSMQERLDQLEKDGKYLIELYDIYFNSQWEAWKQVTALRTALDVAANRFESAVRAVGTPEGPFQRWADEIRTVLSAYDQAQEK